LQTCLGRNPQLEVQVTFTRSASDNQTLVRVVLLPLRCNRRQAHRVLDEVGPMILRSIHACVGADPERRGEERLPLEGTVRVCPVRSSMEMSQPVEGTIRDISLNGMNLVLPSEPPGPQLYIQLQTESLHEAVAILARVRRVHAVAEGSYEVAVQFPFDPIRKPKKPAPAAPAAAPPPPLPQSAVPPPIPISERGRH